MGALLSSRTCMYSCKIMGFIRSVEGVGPHALASRVYLLSHIPKCWRHGLLATIFRSCFRCCRSERLSSKRMRSGDPACPSFPRVCPLDYSTGTCVHFANSANTVSLTCMYGSSTLLSSLDHNNENCFWFGCNSPHMLRFVSSRTVGEGSLKSQVRGWLIQWHCLWPGDFRWFGYLCSVAWPNRWKFLLNICDFMHVCTCAHALMVPNWSDFVLGSCIADGYCLHSKIYHNKHNMNYISPSKDLPQHA